jgi:hypothetical protein
MKIEASLLVMISFAFERTRLGFKYVQIQEFHGFFALNLLGCRCHAAFLRCIGLCVRSKWGLRLLVFLSFFGLFALLHWSFKLNVCQLDLVVDSWNVDIVTDVIGVGSEDFDELLSMLRLCLYG